MANPPKSVSVNHKTVWVRYLSTCLAVDLLGPVAQGMGPLWTGLVPLHPVVAHLNRDLGRLVGGHARESNLTF